MDKDVIVTINGLLFSKGSDGESEDIQVISPGQYYQKNGKHYIVYDEIAEEASEPIHNLLKIGPDQISIRKRGLVNSEMVFDRHHPTASHYSTPYGSMVMGIQTGGMQVKEEAQELNVNVNYRLEINYEHVSDCSIQIQVQSKNAQGFSLQ